MNKHPMQEALAQHLAPTDAEIEALAAKHLKALAVFAGADAWFEGEIEFARAVLTKWGVQPVVREPLTQTEVVNGFCNEPHSVQHVSIFNAGVRFAERAHGITGG